MTIAVIGTPQENSLLTATSIAVTLTGVTAGSTLAVFATCESGRSMTGIGTGGAAGCADSVNGSYGAAPVQNIPDTTDTQRVACWLLQNSASGNPVVTVTFDASANFTGIWAAEVGGAATASADGSNGNWQATPTTTTDATTSGTITPSTQPGLIVSVCSNTNGTGATTAGTGFTDHGTGWAQAGPARFESKRYTTTSPIAGTYTAASNVDHVSLAMLFKEAGGGGGDTLLGQSCL